MANNPKKIIIHHSATSDNKVANDWEAIRRYHKSFRYQGKTITMTQANLLIAKGIPVERPWKDIGYHAGQEYENNRLVRRQGRADNEAGAHCVGMNSQSLGYCFVGNYDQQAPSDEELRFAVPWIVEKLRKYNLKYTDIEPHRRYAQKSCPGSKFPIEKLRLMVKEELSKK